MLTSEEVEEHLQGMGGTLVDKISEVADLKRRLREVRDFEETLEDVNGMAKRLQEAIEEELGIEEVERLKEELEQKEQIQVEGITRTVVKKSVRKTERKEDEVDELEEQIKQVFFKGLLPEEAELDQEREKEMTGEIKRRVTTVDKTGQPQEEVEDMLGQPGVILEDRLEKGRRTETEATERLQELSAKDVWYIMFDRPPYKAVFKSPGTFHHCANGFKALLIPLI